MKVIKRIYYGFTLLNLLVTLTISSLILSVGLPSVTRLINTVQADNIYQRLFTLIQLTRIEAVNYQSQVLLCPTDNETDCIANWNKPLMVFVDRNNNETRDKGELLLKVTKEQSDQKIIHWNASGSKRYLRYKADGSTRNQNGRLSYCLKVGKQIYARQIIVYRSGRARRASEEDALKKCE